MKHGVIRRMTGFPASVRRVARTGVDAGVPGVVPGPASVPKASTRRRPAARPAPVLRSRGIGVSDDGEGGGADWMGTVGGMRRGDAGETGTPEPGWRSSPSWKRHPPASVWHDIGLMASGCGGCDGHDQRAAAG